MSKIGAFAFPRGPKADARDGGKLTFMVRSGGYVMVRRPHCMPFVLAEKEWAKLVDWQPTQVKVNTSSPLVDRFWTKVHLRGPDECWIWKGSLDNRGYGHIGENRQKHLAHRVSWEIANGPIVKALFVCHHCDHPACVNPAHLFLGTHLDNMKDMMLKGRAGSRKKAPGQFMFVHSKLTRHGKVKHYFRKTGAKRTRLPGEIGSPEFLAVYERCLVGEQLSNLDPLQNHAVPSSLKRDVTY